MADDSELDYLKTFFTHITSSTVETFSEVKKISNIASTKRLLIFPPELINIDGKFYTKRYKISLLETSEANLMSTFNQIVEGIDIITKGLTTLDYIYKNISINVNNEDTQPQDITWDGTYFWVIGDTANALFQYTKAGVYTGFSFALTEDTVHTGVVYNGTHLCVLGLVNEYIYKYTLAGVYTGTKYFVGTQVTYGTGLAWDGTYFYVTSDIDEEVYQYNAAGAYQTSFDVSSEDGTPNGIVWDGTSLWMVGVLNQAAFSYTGGTYNSISIDASGETTTPTGIAWDGRFFYIIDYDSKRYYLYNGAYSKPSVLVHVELKYGNKAFEHPKTKNWSVDLYIDVEWCTE